MIERTETSIINIFIPTVTLDLFDDTFIMDEYEPHLLLFKAALYIDLYEHYMKCMKLLTH